MKVNLSVPYNALEILKELESITKEFDTEKKIAAFQKLCQDALDSLKYPETQAELNKVIAEEHGISVVDLINSPNYENLIAKYFKDKKYQLINLLKDKGLSDIRAWITVANIHNHEEFQKALLKQVEGD